MKPRTKMLVAATALTSLIILAAVMVLAGRPVFIADSSIITQPFTNVFFTHAFEKEMIRTFPGVVQLNAMPFYSGPPVTNTVSATNGAIIRIRVIGPTAEAALDFANDAAKKMSQKVSTNYGVKGYIMAEAKTAHSCSSLLYLISSSVNRVGK